MDTKPTYNVILPGKNCGVCGYRSCEELEIELKKDPKIIKRCIFIEQNGNLENNLPITSNINSTHFLLSDEEMDFNWTDSLGREFDFFLEHFPEEPGPREIILPHNPMITRELKVQVGDILIGRPLGMSCGCPVTHCGVAMNVDHRTGVIVWCVTGPLNPRTKGYKDLGYYIAEGYEGMVYRSRCELRIGARYFFQPRMCMLQWRHSGLLNYLNKTPEGLQIRLEGLWIG
jgi:uncharacterized Fe-S cluster-containing protein